MIQNDALINILREAGYGFKVQTARVVIYRKKGSSSRIVVRRRDFHDEDSVRILLKQAGMTSDKIEDFIGSYKINRH